MVHSGGYVKRCRACLEEQRFPLPPAPTPKVLYLDQWAVSNLAKALLPEHRAKFRTDDPSTQSGAWPRLFARIERLVKLGLLVCPPSSIHRSESELDDRLVEPLHRLHRHLAGGARFADHRQVKRDQLYLAFCAWLDDLPVDGMRRDQVISGAGEWLAPLEVTVQLRINATDVDALRRSREAVVPELQRIVETWRAEGPRPFGERYAEQLAAFGPILDIRPLSNPWLLLQRALDDRGVAPRDRQTRIAEFLAGESVMQVPFARIGCGLFAALAWEAGRGQAGKVNRGLRDDFQAVAVYAPYCDAMLVDGTCRRLTVESPLRAELPVGLSVFDVRRLADLDQWLQGLEDEAPAGHVELVRRVYGDGWLQPYYSILE